MPASLQQLAIPLEALSLFCKSLRRKDREHDLWVATWAKDLEGYPADLIEEGCRLWRNTPCKGDLNFPSPGQLKAPIEPILKYRRMIARRAVDTADALGIALPSDLAFLRDALN